MGIKFSQAINEAIEYSMKINKNVICYGLGATDPKNIFGTTAGLEKKFGKKRVFDTPTSENALTGVAIGASMNNTIPIMVHQRLDFFLLALDQLVNNAAKWYYMFGSKKNVPITIRLIIGRGWGQGPTHSQNLQSWFAHIPGIKVVMPTTPEDAKGLLISSIFDPNPVIFLEHRWLHNAESKKNYISNNKIKIGKGRLVKKGNKITIIAMSYLVVEAINASNYLKKYGIDCEIIDLRSIKPIDWKIIIKSLKKTKNLLVLDTGFITCSVSSEIIAYISSNYFNLLKTAPQRIAMPDVPEPTSFYLTKKFYTRSLDIVIKISEMLNVGINIKDCKKELNEPDKHDIPGDWFVGPF